MVKVENIKVAVRVRPFNAREKAKKCKTVVSMFEKTTLLTNPSDVIATPRQFRFDYSYWSHDGFEETDDGYLKPTGPKYVDQRRLFDELGVGLLDNAWSGYNCTLFTYGQTGSGKTYSMMGHGPNKGLLPMLCGKLFREISEKGKHPGIVYQVSCSMVEIYNEKVRDLLNRGEQPQQGLPVRMSPNCGFYVEGLMTSPVADYRSLQYHMEEGNKNRTVAATTMNETSSRAHTLVVISFVQNCIRENRTKRSRIYMVDLAGSERASQTGATGVRFEESKNINRSLMTLGTVIKNLCAVASGRTDQGPVPYRDSKLTMLLKDAIGGNSKTIMVATISPTDEAYEQTLSTLRYADRVKSIKNTAKMNVAATDKLIKELLAEKEALLAKLKNKPDARLGYTEKEIKRLREEQLVEIGQIKSEMLNAEAAWQKRLQETKQHMEEQLERERKEKKERSEIPHMWNLNEDPTLSGKVYYVFKEGNPVTVGNTRAALLPKVELHGPSIAKEHAYLQNRKSVVTLQPLQGLVKVNGVQVIQQIVLKHQDRILFSSNNLFVFHHPQEEYSMRKAGKVMKTITYEMAQYEIGKYSQIDTSEENAWLRQEVAETLVRTQDANAMALQMKRCVVFEPLVIAKLVLGQDFQRSQIYVLVQTGCGGEFIWSRNHFLDRFDLMVDMFQKYENGSRTWEPKIKTQDPFWEPLDTPTLVGVSYIPLESIAYMLDIEEQKIGVYDYHAVHIGYLSVSLIPCTEEEDECSEEMAVEEPIDLSWCHYTFYDEQVRRYTDEVAGAVPKYNFEHTHKMTQLSQNMIQYLEDRSIMVEIYGRQSGNSDQVRRGSTLNTYTIADARRLSTFSGVLAGDADRNSATNMSTNSEPEMENRQTFDERATTLHHDTNNKHDEEVSQVEEHVETVIMSKQANTPTINHSTVDTADHCVDFMDEMRKGITDVMNEVMRVNGVSTKDEVKDLDQNNIQGISQVAANTSVQMMRDAFQANTNELRLNHSDLAEAKKKLDIIYRLVCDKNDSMSLDIKKVLGDM